MIINKKYQITQQIKKDSFGFLYKGYKDGKELSFRQYNTAFNGFYMNNIADLAVKTAELKHRGIVRIIDIFLGTEKELWLVYDTPYEGDLGMFIDKISKLTLDNSLEIINEVGKALEYAHHKGIIHGAINPENIWIMKNGQVKLVNFAIDHLLNWYNLKNNLLLLQTSFMPPEQLKTVVINRRTDTFSLAALLYRLLTGQNPFPQIADRQMHLQNLLKEPVPLTLLVENVPKYVEDIVSKSLKKDPRLRHYSVAEFLGDLRAKKVVLSVPDTMKKIEKLATIQKKNIQLERRERETMSSQDFSTPPSQELSQKSPEIYFDKKKFLRAIIILSIMVGGLLAIIQALFVGYFSSVPTLYVPEVSLIPVAEAKSVLAQAGLRSKISAYTPSSVISENYVIETIPAPGRTVKKNRLIKLIVSKGSEEDKTPLLIGKSVVQAQALLKEKGVELQITDYIYDLQNPANIILKQNPADGSILKQGTTVNVTISKGFPVSISLINDNFATKKVMLSVKVPKGWEMHNIEVLVSDSRGKRTIIEKRLQAEEELIKDLDLENNAFIEVYANQELVFKQSISEIQ